MSSSLSVWLACATVWLIEVLAGARIHPIQYLPLGGALLYACRYVLLMNDDHALLIGSVGLFVILSAIMHVTRRVDGYAIGRRSRQPSRST